MKRVFLVGSSSLFFAFIIACGGPGRENPGSSTSTNTQAQAVPKGNFLSELLVVNEVVEVIPDGKGEVKLFEDYATSSAWSSAIAGNNSQELAELVKNGKVIDLPLKTKVQITKIDQIHVWVKVITGSQKDREGIVRSNNLVPKDRIKDQ